MQVNVALWVMKGLCVDVMWHWIQRSGSFHDQWQGDRQASRLAKFRRLRRCSAIRLEGLKRDQARILHQLR
jgi:hypothetical protein